MEPLIGRARWENSVYRQSQDRLLQARQIPEALDRKLALRAARKEVRQIHRERVKIEVQAAIADRQSAAWLRRRTRGSVFALSATGCLGMLAVVTYFASRFCGAGLLVSPSPVVVGGSGPRVPLQVLDVGERV
eukprot:1460355-Prorocentrum_lima.AAC.1